MKVTPRWALGAIGLLAMSTSCHKNDNAPCPDQEIAGTSAQLYPCVLDRNEQEAKLFVLNSVEEYGDTFPCSSTLPSQVDFTKYTLLVGWKNYCCCGHVKSQRLLYSCTSNTYVYKVEIEAGVCQAVLPVTSQLLVPKLPAGARVVIDMQ